MIRSVAIIDDDIAVLQSLEALFAASGFQVSVFRSAEEFLAQLDRSAPGCVITDLRMPGMDGLTLIRNLKGEDGVPWPVVLISGHAEVRDAVAAMQAGAEDVLIKPFPPQKLVAVVTACLARYQDRRLPAGPELKARFETLSAREREIVTLLTAGGSSKSVGQALGISPRTVDVLRGRVMRKIGVGNIAALSLAVAAIRPKRR